MTIVEVPRERCPNGASERVLVNVEPEILATLKARARKQGKSLSSVTRSIIVRGMAADDKQRTPPVTQRHTTSVAEG